MDTDRHIFNKTTVIKPAPDSGKFFREDTSGSMSKAQEQIHGKDAQGNDVVLKSVPYKAARFNGTIQAIGARWNHANKRWSIIDPDDITKTKLLKHNNDYIDGLVAKAKLINKRKDHPEYGQYIEKADITDRRDPFFTHPEARLSLSAGEAFVSTSSTDALNVVLVLALIARKDFMLGSASSNARRGTRIKYVVVDKGIEQQIKKDIRTRRIQAQDYYNKLDTPKKLKVAIALGLINSVSIDSETVETVLFDYSQDYETTVGKGNNKKTKQEVFLQLIESGKGTIEASYVFNLGKSKGIVRLINKNYEAFGERIGATMKEAVKTIAEPENDLYQRILEAAEVTK